MAPERSHRPTIAVTPSSGLDKAAGGKIALVLLVGNDKERSDGFGAR